MCIRDRAGGGADNGAGFHHPGDFGGDRIDVYKRQGQFTGMEGKYVPISETIRSFREILEGEHDDIPESYFLNAGSIDDVLARVK